MKVHAAYAATNTSSTAPTGRSETIGRPSTSAVLAGSARNTTPLSATMPSPNEKATKLNALAISVLDSPQDDQSR